MAIQEGVREVIPTTVREGVLFFVRSTFGTTTLISGPFEIGISHAQDHVVATPGRTDHAAVVPGTAKGREALDVKGRHTVLY
jgi:hypothetical protein